MIFRLGLTFVNQNSLVSCTAYLVLLVVGFGAWQTVSVTTIDEEAEREELLRQEEEARLEAKLKKSVRG